MPHTAPPTKVAAAPARRPLFGGGTRLWLLVLPAVLFLAIFFVLPVMSMLAISLDRAVQGVVTFQGHFVTNNFERFLSRPAYYLAAVRSISIAATVTAICLTRAPGGVGQEQAHSDGTARGAGRRGQAAAGRRWPGFTAPTWWSRWRVT